MLGEKKQSQNVGKLGASAEGSCMLLGRLDLVYMKTASLDDFNSKAGGKSSGHQDGEGQV